MDFNSLNQQLSKLLANFDLNQKYGGGSLVIFYQGQVVTTLAHGIAKLDRTTGDTTPWTIDTLSLNFSTGKGVLVTLIHRLVSEGILAYDRPISEYWQAFAQNGKQAISLRDILTHEAGLFDITAVTEHAKDMLDWQTMLTNIEQMQVYQPSSNPQTDNTNDNVNVNQNATTDDGFVAYSALVSGWVLGGLIEKVTQLPLQKALEQYLLEPLGLVGQAYFGVPADKVAQVAEQIREKDTHAKPVLTTDTAETMAFYQTLGFYQDWQRLAKTDNALTTQAINGLYFRPTQVDPNDYKSALVPAGSRQFNYYHPTSLQAKIPAANGVATSMALATIYAMLANDGQWQGKSLIKAEIFAELSQIHNQQFDKIMPAVMQWRLGYHRVFSLFADTTHAFGHMGYNGSMAWCDPSRELAVAYVHNYDVTMLNDVRQFILNETVLACRYC
ncbi:MULTISPECIES: serine hydrolase domain-containing protein [unclassified Moraxella]|uniref:serine hydrolase domain-containing protein n=1 Tax=unclassified Moraxella TaxID=2685852 RepID=UPI003AF7B446